MSYFIDEYENGNFRIEDLLDKVINESIENKILYIIRGIPGSGKSTLANKLTSNVVEADTFYEPYVIFLVSTYILHLHT